MLLRCAPARVHAVDVCEQHESRGVEVSGEEGCRQVLVDDGLDADQSAGTVADDGDAAASGANHDDAVLHQQLDRVQLGDLQWFG